MPAPRTPPKRGTTCRPGRGPLPADGCGPEGAAAAGAGATPPPVLPGVGDPATRPAVLPTPGQGRTRKRGNGKRSRSAQAAAVAGERATPASPSAASAVSASNPPVTAAGCARRLDQVDVAGGEAG